MAGSANTLVTAPVVPPRRRGRGFGSALRRGRTGYLLVAPFLVCFAVMFVAPLGYAAYVSLFTSRLVGGTVFAGLQNYRDVLHDPAFRDGVLRMARFLLTQVPVMLFLAVAFALAIDSGRLRAPRFVRLSIFLPYAVPSVVAALMWGYFYSPTFGPIAQVAQHLGLGAPNLLSDSWMLPSIANIVTWEFVGYNMIIFYAALRAVPPELYEAAAVDGASARHRFFNITLPLLKPLILVALVIRGMDALREFDIIFVLTGGGPGNATETVALATYRYSFRNYNMGLGSAVSYIIFAVAFALSLFFVRQMRRAQAE
jgi:multiple sugar transport system permease protein